MALSSGLAGCQRSEQLCDNSDGSWTTSHPIYDGAVDVLRLHASGRITLNQREIGETALRERLRLQGDAPVAPAVLLRHDTGVPCWEVVEMRSLMRETLECDKGQCLEGGEWARVPDAGLPGGF